MGPGEAWTLRVLPACSQGGKHPRVLLREGWRPDEINEMAAAWEVIQELRARQMQEA